MGKRREKCLSISRQPAFFITHRDAPGQNLPSFPLVHPSFLSSTAEKNLLEILITD
jgi:hypothetical protein